jgi:hypothetical protein
VVTHPTETLHYFAACERVKEKWERMLQEDMEAE